LARSSDPVPDLVQPGAGTDLVRLRRGRPANADHTDDFVTQLDSQRSRAKDHALGRLEGERPGRLPRSELGKPGR
jgi:hypothetical protein